jgi:hypothetical protein
MALRIDPAAGSDSSPLADGLVELGEALEMPVDRLVNHALQQLGQRVAVTGAIIPALFTASVWMNFQHRKAACKLLIVDIVGPPICRPLLLQAVLDTRSIHAKIIYNQDLTQRSAKRHSPTRKWSGGYFGCARRKLQAFHADKCWRTKVVRHVITMSSVCFTLSATEIVAVPLDLSGSRLNQR